jgi:hypothetical protein
MRYKKDQLITMAEERNLPSHGIKMEISKRIAKYDSDRAEKDWKVISSNKNSVKVNIPKKGEYTYFYKEGSNKAGCGKNIEEYELTYSDSSWSCSCMGFSYRRYCSHIDNVPQEIKDLLENQKAISIKDPIKEGAKEAFRQTYNHETGKMEPIYKEDGSKMSAHDEFWT